MIRLNARRFQHRLPRGDLGIDNRLGDAPLIGVQCDWSRVGRCAGGKEDARLDQGRQRLRLGPDADHVFPESCRTL